MVVLILIWRVSLIKFNCSFDLGKIGLHGSFHRQFWRFARDGVADDKLALSFGGESDFVLLVEMDLGKIFELVLVHLLELGAWVVAEDVVAEVIEGCGPDGTGVVW